MHVAGRLHVCDDVLLQFWERCQLIWYVLILLNITNDLSRLRPFGKIDEIRFLDNGWNAVLNESQIRQIHTYTYD